MKSKIVIPALVLAAGVATAGGLAYAKQTGVTGNDAVTDLAKAKVSLVQAVNVAEAQAGGKAIKAELDGEDGQLDFIVEVVTADSKVFDVRVDATGGKVVSSKQDSADRGGKESDEDD
ncbi:MAG: PepSY domain-containing protein [Rhizobacter sp.]|nr:PepSY domain-containing protein [Rhizobacter sp.]